MIRKSKGSHNQLLYPNYSADFHFIVVGLTNFGDLYIILSVMLA